MFDNQIHWFAARTRVNQEINVRESLLKLEMTHFLPTHFVTRIYSDRRKSVEVPVINSLIFVKCTKREAFALIKSYSLKISYIKDVVTGSLLVVPDKQMDNFMLAMHVMSDLVQQCDETLAKGDKVRVIKGDFTGFEGELVRIEGKTHVMLRIPQILTISIKIPKSHLQKITSSKSENAYNKTKQL